MLMPRSMRFLMVLTALALVAPLLSGCESVRYKTVCPTLVTYSLTDQTQLAQELAADPQAVMTHRVVRDYVGLRDQVRACQESGK
ncbi:hypothetical protein HK16_10680 [Acetobacter senegalensis]|uniref:Lipoprotein n=3 Tax=Acetobacteraceae TaxID=433 RepID=A0A252EIU5_9PROT|nr:hypothetical protein CIW82_00465 [Acetobacter tropicalis]OUL66337.1 hypothetical protein HK16_10680 [Acetobacter senegalensis]